MVMGIDQAHFDRDIENPDSIRGRKLRKTRFLLKLHVIAWIGIFLTFFIFAVVWNANDKVELDASCSNTLVNYEQDCTCLHEVK